VLEAFNVFDAKVSDIDNFYASRLLAARPSLKHLYLPWLALAPQCSQFGVRPSGPRRQ